MSNLYIPIRNFNTTKDCLTKKPINLLLQINNNGVVVQIKDLEIVVSFLDNTIDIMVLENGVQLYGNKDW